MKSKQLMTILILGLGLLLLLTTGQSASAAPPPQTDPATQCAEGVELFLDGQAAEALSLLEAGFANRETATFADQEDEAFCALALGLLRDSTGNRSGEIDNTPQHLGSSGNRNCN